MDAPPLRTSQGCFATCADLARTGSTPLASWTCRATVLTTEDQRCEQPFLLLAPINKRDRRAEPVSDECTRNCWNPCRSSERALRCRQNLGRGAKTAPRAPLIWRETRQHARNRPSGHQHQHDAVDLFEQDWKQASPRTTDAAGPDASAAGVHRRQVRPRRIGKVVRQKRVVAAKNSGCAPGSRLPPARTSLQRDLEPHACRASEALQCGQARLSRPALQTSDGGRKGAR
jgi:hypothetical protein